jgi:hypothetical protein
MADVRGLIVRELIVRAVTDASSVTDLPAGDLDLLLRVLRRVRLLGRLAHALRARDRLSTLPRAARDILESALVATDARARVTRWELACVARALADAPSLKLIAMKGCAYLLADLPNAPGRLFADVDLLVPADRLADVERRLTAKGWRAAALSPYDERYYREWAHELPPMTHSERDVEVDLHHNVLMRTARLHPDSARLVEEAVPAADESRYFVLAPIDMALHAMTHLFCGDEMDDRLRELVDIDALLRHFGRGHGGFWSRFMARAREVGLARPAFYGLHFAARLLATPVPAEVLIDARRDGPPSIVLGLMNRLVPAALFPPHPDRPSRRTGVARWLLYLRTHWIRMPLPMLVPHLLRKFLVRRGFLT